MSLKRVVITGRGAVSPFGLGVKTLIDGIWAGRSAIQCIPQWQQIEGMKSLLAAPAPPMDIKKLLSRSVRRTMGKTATFATLATQEAIAEAQLSSDDLISGNAGVAIGATTGSPAAYEHFYETYLPEMNITQIKSGEFFKMMGHTCAANVCLALGIEGQQWAPTSACTSSAQAIGLGFMLIQSGRQEIMLCGGSDEVHHSVTGVFDILKAASCRNDEPDKTPSPFDRDRDGVVCGEGSGIIVLESLESAMARGAHIYAEILGFGNITDSKHIANPHEAAMAKAMQAALDEAQIHPEEVDYVNAHATGTVQGDIAESAAIASIFGNSTPVSSIKGHIGHTLGAAGSLEIITVLEMMERQELIATRNLTHPDPLCKKIGLFDKTKKRKLLTVVKNNFALGGVNTALVLRRVVA